MESPTSVTRRTFDHLNVPFPSRIGVKRTFTVRKRWDNKQKEDKISDPCLVFQPTTVSIGASLSLPTDLTREPKPFGQGKRVNPPLTLFTVREGLWRKGGFHEEGRGLVAPILHPSLTPTTPLRDLTMESRPRLSTFDPDWGPPGPTASPRQTRRRSLTILTLKPPSVYPYYSSTRKSTKTII